MYFLLLYDLCTKFYRLELLECCQTSNDSIFSRETVLILGSLILLIGNVIGLSNYRNFHILGENPFSLGLVTKSDQDFGYSFVKNDESSNGKHNLEHYLSFIRLGITF